MIKRLFCYIVKVDEVNKFKIEKKEIKNSERERERERERENEKALFITEFIF